MTALGNIACRNPSIIEYQQYAEAEAIDFIVERLFYQSR